MRKFVWGATWLGVGLWSLLAWSAYGVLSVGTHVLTGGADLAPRAPGSFTTGDPPLLEPLFPLIALVQSFGFATTAGVWLFVSAAMLGTAWLVTRFLPRPRITGTYTGTYAGTTTIEPPRRVPSIGTRGHDPAAMAKDLVARFARKRR